MPDEDAMEREHLEAFARLAPTIHGAAGKIVPSREAILLVEASHPDETDAEKWRLAQAQTLLDLFERTRPRREVR